MVAAHCHCDDSAHRCRGGRRCRRGDRQNPLIRIGGDKHIAAESRQRCTVPTEAVTVRLRIGTRITTPTAAVPVLPATAAITSMICA